MIKNIQEGTIIESDKKVIKIFGGEGESAYGIVYICKNIRYNEIFALKTFQDNILKDSNKEYFINSFKKEASSWIKLNNHPNIVTAANFEIYEGRPFISMEAICPNNGKQSLDDYFNDNLSEIKIIDWGIQFCSGMEYANSHGISSHNDLKPKNILIKNNVLKIGDFGCAKIIDETFKFSSENYKEDDLNYGSYYYSAPECYDNKYSIKSDIYSFGMIFYQLINEGKLPFSSEEYAKIFRKIKIPKKLNLIFGQLYLNV